MAHGRHTHIPRTLWTWLLLPCFVLGRQVDLSSQSGLGLKEAANQIVAGDVLKLSPGVFSGPRHCGIVLSSDADVQIVGQHAVIDCSASNTRWLTITGGRVWLKGLTIRGGSSDRGGCISAAEAELQVSDSHFMNCTSQAKGGAVHVAGGSSTFDAVTFENCSASQGGAIFGSRTRIEMQSCTLSGHYSTEGGGAVAVSSGSTLVLESCHVRDNYALKGGGCSHNRAPWKRAEGQNLWRTLLKPAEGLWRGSIAGWSYETAASPSTRLPAPEGCRCRKAPSWRRQAAGSKRMWL